MDDHYFSKDYFIGFTEGMYEPHLHNSHFELSLCMQGNSRVLINEKLQEVKSPFVLLFSPNTLHRIIQDKNKIYERYNINFRSAAIINAMPEISRSFKIFSSDGLIIPLTPEEAEKLVSYIHQMDEYEKEGKLMLLALIFINVCKYSQNYKQTELNNLTYINDVLVYIEKNINKKLIATDIACYFYISRVKLDMDFKKETGITLNKYIILLRLKNAKALLHNGYSVSESALKSGFNDKNHFIRCFKKHTGITPLKYAKKYYINH